MHSTIDLCASTDIPQHPADIVVIVCMQLLKPFPEAEGDPLCGYYSPFGRMLTSSSYGHRVHDEALLTALLKDGSEKRVYMTLADWNEDECNILLHTWPYNRAIRAWDGQIQDILVDFDSLRQDNEPYWPAVLPPIRPLPVLSVVASVPGSRSRTNKLSTWKPVGELCLKDNLRIDQ